jgi:hypothetical protein
MSYADFEATGTSVPFACSICGRRRLFPDHLVYSDDKLFRCTDACDERTAYNVDQQRAAWRAPPEPVPSIGGPLPQGDVVTTFLQDAVERRSQVIPGWTPTTTFYDDFTTLPGTGSSLWAIGGSGQITPPTQPSAGVARFSDTSMIAASVSVPTANAANFYCAFKAIAAVSSTSIMRCGIIGGGIISAVGIFSAGSAFFRLSAGAVVSTPVEKETTNYHLFEMWWKAGGYTYASVDGSVYVSARPATAGGTKNPWLNATNTGGGYMDITDSVFMV